MKIFFREIKILFFVLALLYSQFGVCQELSLEELEKLFSEAVSTKDDGKASFYSYEIAKIYWDQNRPADADKYLSQSISHGKKASDIMLQYLAYQLTAYIQSQEKDHNKALNNYQKALKLAQELGRKEFISEGLIDVALSYAALGRDKKVPEPLEEALSIAIREKDIVLQQRCYELLVEAYGKLGNSAKAKEYETLHTNLLEKLETEELTEQQLKELEKLEMKVQQTSKEKKTASSQLYRQTRKLRLAEDSLLATKYSLAEIEESLRVAEEIKKNQQLEIDILNKDKELAAMQILEQKTRLRNEALIRNSIIIGILLASSLVLVLVRSYRRKIEANKEIDRQNKSIQSSINYAKRIQEAMLHKSAVREEILPNSFVLFKPRDSVSGDFYWISEIKSWYDPDIVIAAVDCTGHGIPGAFMSMIGLNALNTIISQGTADSDEILKKLDGEIRAALQQESTGNKDGMDVALCIYRKEKGIIEFSGAKNPLVYIQNNELTQIKGDVHPIGGYKPKKEFSFKKHIVPIDEPTTIYLYSDGYQDQFGGPDNQKFLSSRFKELLLEIHRYPINEQRGILEKTIEEWKDGGKQTDDILVMGFQLDPMDV